MKTTINYSLVSIIDLHCTRNVTKCLLFPAHRHQWSRNDRRRHSYVRIFATLFWFFIFSSVFFNSMFRPFIPPVTCFPLTINQSKPTHTTKCTTEKSLSLSLSFSLNHVPYFWCRSQQRLRCDWATAVQFDWIIQNALRNQIVICNMLSDVAARTRIRFRFFTNSTVFIFWWYWRGCRRHLLTTPKEQHTHWNTGSHRVE